ncbi:MAG TPA: membrane-bound O-acyltransferase family protein [Treponema sp.]|nr:membrane-bound O-acyltransferase family protein [Treponema sp.]
MIFNSLVFLLFFPVVAAGYFLLTMWFAPRNQTLANILSRILLLAASLIFYGYWNPIYLILIMISVAVTWASGLLMEERKVRTKRLVLTGSLVINLGILFFFKYYNFFVDSIRFLTRNDLSFPAFNVLLPVGISFYTFQAIGYSEDMFYGKVQAERDFITYALFVTFFPQLVAGPIERTGNLLPQFKVNHQFDYERVTSGLRLAAWGMFKKVVIADRLAIYVNGVFGNPGVYPAAALALATFFFAIQIYCDFSGYSDIAIGCAHVLGFNLMNNFRQPYFSRSITEFWRRWHISLSTWLKDYLYIPLGGNRKGKVRQKINLLITFLISGLWHGAAWNFVVWGAMHGVYQIIGRSTESYREVLCNRMGLGGESRLRKILQVCVTFVLVCFAWIFFRANTLSDAILITTKLAQLPVELAGYARGLPRTGIIGTVRNAFQMGGDVANPIADFGLRKFGGSVIFILILLISDRWSMAVPNNGIKIGKKPLALRWVGYYALIMMILLSWNAGSSQFIYFTF